MEGPSARLRLRVQPGARRAAVLGRHGAGWRVRVTAPPERGRATAEALSLLAETLDLRRADVRLLAGGASRDKVVEARGIDLAEAERRLERAGGER